MIVETYEFALLLIAEGRAFHSEHDAEFERYLGMKKMHMFHIKHRKELVHMYQPGKQAQQPQQKKPTKPGQKPAPKPNLGQSLAGMMKYHGYKAHSKKGDTRLVFSRDQNNKYHEIHVDVDKKGEPRAIYHKERFK